MIAPSNLRKGLLAAHTAIVFAAFSAPSHAEHPAAKDYVQAHKWYDLAAGPAKCEGYCPAGDRRDEVASKMTPAQIAEAERLAWEWRKKRQQPRQPSPDYAP